MVVLLANKLVVLSACGCGKSDGAGCSPKRSESHATVELTNTAADPMLCLLVTFDVIGDLFVTLWRSWSVFKVEKSSIEIMVSSPSTE
jgi:hypothetical protein